MKICVFAYNFEHKKTYEGLCKLKINKVGQKNLNFFWCESFNFKEKLLSKESSVNDCLVFKTKHEKWYKKSKKNYDHTRYNYAPHEFKGLIENLSHEFLPSNNVINNLKIHIKNLLSYLIK